MALFDVNDSGFELLPFDTQGTRSGTTRAVNNAAAEGVRLVLGPLVADNVQSAGIAARRHNLQVIGFTTDSTKVGGNVMTLGILPNDQGKRIAQYAANANLNRIAIITTNDSYARAVISAFETESATQNVTIVEKQALRSAADASRIAQMLKAQEERFDAIFMPIGNPHLANMARSLAESQLGTNVKPWLGAGLWDDTAIQSNPLMRNAVYAAPSPQQRTNFERQYRSVYGENPHRLASLAYDATALSIVMLRQDRGTITRPSLLNPNGFSGIDGIFRFQQSGLPERGLAIHKIVAANRTTIVENAPSSFVTAGR
jgi:ABC-type branched-subunit amino acid transport system substrate-binding protein